MADEEYEYDLAFSFAGEDKALVEATVRACQKLGFKVFFYHDVVNEWLGKDFMREQRKIYGEGTRYFVPFISRYYLAKPITTDEFRTAISTDVQKFGGYILPLKLDDTKIPGDLLQPSTEYLRVDGKSPEEIATILYERVHGRPSAVQPDVQEPLAHVATSADFKRPKPLTANFNAYKAGQEVLDYLESELQRRIGSLEEAGYAATLMKQDGMVALRIESGNRLVYALDAWQGISHDDKALGFNEGSGSHSMSKTSMTATASLVPGDAQAGTCLKVMNFSLLPQTGSETILTKKDFLEAVWNKVLERLDQARGFGY